MSGDPILMVPTVQAEAMRKILGIATKKKEERKQKEREDMLKFMGVIQ